MTAPILWTDGVSFHWGALTVADNVSLALRPGERRALIGPNGAGKTTLINLLAGALPVGAGRIHLDGKDVSRLGQAARTRKGVVRTFQISQLFKTLSVVENVIMALAERRRFGWQVWRPLAGRQALTDEARHLLSEFALTENADHIVGQLPYGRQRLLDLVLALALNPKVLLLDEPAAGVSSTDNHMIIDALERLDPDVAILMVEHDMDLVFRFAQQITVMVRGRILVEGPPQQIANDPAVRAVYLGDAEPTTGSAGLTA